MPRKKVSKGVLERIGDAATSAAEVVIKAGSKAMHAVGDMMPAGSAPKGAKASPKAAKAKTSKSAPKTLAKASKTSKARRRRKPPHCRPRKLRRRKQRRLDLRSLQLHSNESGKQVRRVELRIRTAAVIMIENAVHDANEETHRSEWLMEFAKMAIQRRCRR